MFSIKQRRQYEMETIRSNLIENQANNKPQQLQQQQNTEINGMKHLLTQFLQPKMYRPFFVLIGLFFFQQISGPYVIIFYAIDLFVKIGRNSDNINMESMNMVLCFCSVFYVLSWPSCVHSKCFVFKLISFLFNFSLTIYLIIWQLFKTHWPTKILTFIWIGHDILYTYRRIFHVF